MRWHPLSPQLTASRKLWAAVQEEGTQAVPWVEESELEPGEAKRAGVLERRELHRKSSGDLQRVPFKDFSQLLIVTCMWRNYLWSGEEPPQRMRTATVQSTDTKCWWGCGATRTLTAGGNANGAATVVDSWADSYKTKQTFKIWSSNCAPCYLSKGIEKLMSTQDLHTGVCSSFIHNCQNLEGTKMPFHGWVEKLWCIQMVEYYSALKRNELSSCEKTWGKLKCILKVKEAKLERPQTVWFQPYDILERAKLWRQ